jgi:hypothetical protein
MFKLTLRELFLFVLLAAVAVAWWFDRAHLATEVARVGVALEKDRGHLAQLRAQLHQGVEKAVRQSRQRATNRVNYQQLATPPNMWGDGTPPDDSRPKGR